MEAFVKPLEQLLMPLFKSLPSLPENGKKALVKFWPWLAAIAGILQLWTAYVLWNMGHALYNSVWSDLYAAAGVTPQLGVVYYLGLAVVALDGVLLLLAISPLNAHKKSGWDLLFLGGVLNLAYGIVMAFDTYYGGMGSLLGAIVVSAIGFYFLFQVRDYYTGTKSVDSGAKPKA